MAKFLKKAEKQMQQKRMTVPFELKETKEEDGYFYFSGYASTFNNEDFGGDVVVKGAFSKTIAEKKTIPILWQHDTHNPLGIYTSLKEDEHGLFVEGKMPLDDDFVKGRVMPQMKIGSLSKMSIGYMIVDSERKDNIRYLKELNLIETSIVTFPMNPKAGITAMKSAVPFQDLPLADRDMEWESDEAIENIKEFTDSLEMPSETYKNAFLWFDSENEGEFGSYKLPIADVVDGELVAVPRAIFSAAGALMGARGGLDIPDEDRDAIIANLNRYYDKMEMESPFNNDKINKSRVELTVKTVRDAEELLRDIGFSQSGSKAMIAIIRKASDKEDKEYAFFKALAELKG